MSMRFSIDIALMTDGTYEASCPEMGLSASGGTLDDVFDEMKKLVLFQISNSEETAIASVDEEKVLRQLDLVFKDKNFCLPRNPKVH